MPTGAIALSSGTGGTWDSGTWDSALWGGDVTLNTLWYTAHGLGYAMAPHIRVTSNAAVVKWAATDYLYETGAVL